MILLQRIILLQTGVTDEKLLQKAEEILLEIGQMYQVQDDYLDCYADPKTFGKIGNDIEENKCSWLIVKALELANNKQKMILKVIITNAVTCKNSILNKRIWVYLMSQLDCAKLSCVPKMILY
jgi:geranylgeranyl pyrophosphate synthase